MEILDKAILLISCIVEIYIFYDFFGGFCDRRENMKELWKILIGSILAVAGLFGVNALENALLNLTCFVLILWLYLFVMFQANMGSRMLYFIVVFSVSFGCEFLFVVLLGIPSFFLGRSTLVNLSDIPWQMFTMKLLNYIILLVVKQAFGKKKHRISRKIFVYYLCVPISSLGIMLLTYYSGIDFNQRFSMKIMLSVCFALMLFGNILIFYGFNRYAEELYNNIQQRLVIEKQENDLSHYAQMQEINKKHREFIHNTSHYLHTIGKLAEENENESIVNILKELDVELENSAMEVYSYNPVLNSVITEKISHAKNHNIKTDIFVEQNANLIGIQASDIITIVGNMLDNAIQAVDKLEDSGIEKKIFMRIFTENNESFYVIKVSNPFDGILKKDESGLLTTKKEKGIHGVGLKSVEKTAKKYNGYLEFFTEENVFTAVVILAMK